MYKLEYSIEFEDIVTDLLFHPIKNILFIGLSNGNIIQYDYVDDYKSLIAGHGDSCRHMVIGGDDVLFSVGADGMVSCFDISNRKLFNSLDTGSESLCRVHILSDESNMNKVLVTGSDNGCIKLWDYRIDSHMKPLFSFSDHIDYISGLSSRYGNILVSTSGDSTICAYDIRKGKLKAGSEPLDSDILSSELIQKGKYFVCGMGDGSINVYKWDYWLKPVDRVVIDEESSIDSIALSPNEEYFYIGSSDGYIRRIESSSRMVDENLLINTNIRRDGSIFVKDALNLSIANLAISDITEDGNELIAQGHLDNFVHIWSLNSSQNEEPIKNPDIRCEFKDLD